MHATLPLLEQTDFPAIQRTKLDTLQVNLGYKAIRAASIATSTPDRTAQR